MVEETRIHYCNYLSALLQPSPFVKKQSTHTPFMLPIPSTCIDKRRRVAGVSACDGNVKKKPKPKLFNHQLLTVSSAETAAR